MGHMPYDGYKWVFRNIDVCTKFAMSRCMKDKESSSCGKVLAGIWAEFGMPGIMQCDNGAEFKGEMQEVAEKWMPGHNKVIHGRYVYHC
jgi:hypothetical protein